MHKLCMRLLTHAMPWFIWSSQGGCLFEGFDGFENVIHMTRHLQAAPFFLENAVWANQECAAFDAFDLLAVHNFIFDDAEHMTHLLLRVSNQFEWEFKLFLEVIVGFHVVT